MILFRNSLVFFSPKPKTQKKDIKTRKEIKNNVLSDQFILQMHLLK